MKNAVKLNLEVPMPFFNRAKVVVGQHVIKKHGYGVGEFDKPRAVRKYIPRKQAELVREVLPESIKDGLVGVNLTEIRLLAPHIHINEMSVINFYLETNNEKTSFWDGEIIYDDSIVSDNGNGYWNLDQSVLTEIEHFVAQPGDVWLLNTRTPHSVGYLNDDREGVWRFEPLDDEKRMLMQAFFNLPFDEVRTALNSMVLS